MLGVDLRWLGLLWRVRTSPETLLACSGLNRRLQICGWLPRHCVWLFGYFASWVVDLWCLGPPLHARASSWDSSSYFGSTPPLAKLPVAVRVSVF